tara:strand:+ start:2478 stop:2672 length:195 start_codon:yes stop_codon:yes gene_type:complete
MTEKQEAIDNFWRKYKNTLELLNNALEENAVLKQQLSNAEIDLSTPSDIADLEKKIEDKLGQQQ